MPQGLTEAPAYLSQVLNHNLQELQFLCSSNLIDLICDLSQ